MSSNHLFSRFLITALASMALLSFSVGSVLFAQDDETRGVEILEEGVVGEIEAAENEESPMAIGNAILDPISLYATVGFTPGGAMWFATGASTGLWLGNLRLSGEFVLDQLDPNLIFQAQTQIGNLAVTGGSHLSNRGMELSGGIHTTISGLAIAAQIMTSGGAVVGNGSVSTQMKGLNLFAGVGFSGSGFNLSTGFNMPAGPLTLSAGASIPSQGGLVLNGGADLALSESLRLNTGMTLTGGRTELTGGGHLTTDTLSGSVTGSVSDAGLGVRAHGEVRLGGMEVFGTYRMDDDSYSMDVGGTLPMGAFETSLAVGLDAGGFKWAELTISAEL